jgi:hypothetical protein
VLLKQIIGKLGPEVHQGKLAFPPVFLADFEEAGRLRRLKPGGDCAKMGKTEKARFSYERTDNRPVFGP